MSDNRQEHKAVTQLFLEGLKTFYTGHKISASHTELLVDEVLYARSLKVCTVIISFFFYITIQTPHSLQHNFMVDLVFTYSHTVLIIDLLQLGHGYVL